MPATVMEFPPMTEKIIFDGTLQKITLLIKRFMGPANLESIIIKLDFRNLTLM